MQAIIALDIGSTGAKAALVSRDGRLPATGYAEYPTLHPAPNRVEQRPEEWWAAVCAALGELWKASPLPPSAVAAVALSGQMQDTILLGENGALGNAILYSDSRAGDEAALIDERKGGGELTRRTGNLQGGSSVLAKWLWLQRHEPKRLAAAHTLLLGAHDYIGWRLTGVAAADFTTASTTGLLDLSERMWLVDVLAELGLDGGLLPPLLSGSERLGAVRGEAAQATGLPEGLPVFHGAGDLGAMTVGVGAGLPGRAYCYLGTSGWIAAGLDRATPNPEAGLFTLRHPQPERLIQVAPMLTAGGNLDWLRGALGRGQAVGYAEMEALAASAPAGSRGVLYLPYLAGERSPFTDPHARACFVGMGSDTGAGELARAVLEGTALAYRSLCGVLGLGAGEPLLLAGGGGKSPVWCQILADVLNRPVHLLAEPGNAGALGAAILAGVGLGWYDSLYPDDAFFPVATRYEPETGNAALYDELYPLFERLYPQLRESFAALARLRAGVV